MVDAVGGVAGLAVVAVEAGSGGKDDEITFAVMLALLLASKAKNATGALFSC